MIIKVITPEEFNQKYDVKGSLEGNFADAEEYLGWVLSSKGTDNGKHFDEAVKVFGKRFNMPYLTTKYLRGLISPDIQEQNHRIKRVFKSAGYGLVVTKRYGRTLTSINKKINNIIYQNKDGKLEFKERKEMISRMISVFVGERLHKLVSKEEMAKTRSRLNQEIFKMNFLKQTEENNNNTAFGHILDWRKIGEETSNAGMTLSWNKDFKCFDIKRNLFIKNKINHYEKIKKDTNGERDRIKRQEKAIRKLEQKKQLWNTHNCSLCKHEMKLPIYTDIKDEKVFDIMNVAAKDIKDGVKVCLSCQKKIDKTWLKNKIIDFCIEVMITSKENEGVSFKAGDFCKEYKTDKEEISPGKVREALMGYLRNQNLDNNLKVMTSGDLIKIQVIKKG